MDMSGMFRGATKFNQPLPWNVASLRSASGMFLYAAVFNGSLPWGNTTGNIRTISYMFSRAHVFN
jgi:hypothetical protein